MVNGSQCVELESLYQRAWGIVANDSQVMKEVERARVLNPASIALDDFIREYAWVVFNSGIHMRTIRKKWDALENAFRDWNCAAILENRSSVEAEALKVLNHQKKVGAIFHTAQVVMEQGWAEIEAKILDGMVKDGSGNIYPSEQFFACVCALPWMGRANSRFLAKNLGFDLAKNDRHLRRLAEEYGHTPDADGVQRFVEKVSQCVGGRISVVETVLWNACERGRL